MTYPSKMTKADWRKLAEARERLVNDTAGDLRRCRDQNRDLTAKAEQREKGWKIVIHEQTLSSDYARLRETANILLDRGLWFFELKKVD